uniref:PB1-like domain-containing protein n=1 Tax=Chenopodium quinoa TaxID=63459 RepID=A0A803M6I5_CHEQI
MSKNSLSENVSLRYWHGGNFKIVGNGELVYMGGKGRTFQVSPDELCYWELLELGTKCGDYIKIAALYYLVPGKSLADGLRKIAGDAEVLEMGEIVMKHRSIDVYVLHSDKELQVSAENPNPEFVPDEEDEEEGIDVELEVEDDDFEVDEGLDRVDLVTGESDNSDEEPSQLGRGGRVIYSGRGARGGARGGATSGARGGAVRGTRGGRGRGRAGVGVLFSADGTPVLQAPFTRNRARNQEAHISTQSSQTSTVHQQHP